MNRDAVIPRPYTRYKTFRTGIKFPGTNSQESNPVFWNLKTNSRTLIVTSLGLAGEGNDGPGWEIPDEMHPDLKHVGGGVVSMANSDANTGGSQVFVTMAQFPETEAQLAALDGRHSIFGIIEEGHDITQDIGRIPLVGSSPAEGWEVTINSVKIVRQGEAANAWDPSLYWESPVFSEEPIRATFELEDIDNNPDTPPSRSLRTKFRRELHSHYTYEDSSDLQNWRPRTFPRNSIPASFREEVRALNLDVSGDRRHYYRLLKAEFPPVPSLEGQRLTINFDPIEDTEDDQIEYLPENLTLYFYDSIIGKWQLKRSDSETLKPWGNIGLHQQFPLAHRSQVRAELDIFTDLQAYLDPTGDPSDPDSGSVFLYYRAERPEGRTVTGTYTFSDAGEPPVPENKNLVQLVLTIVTEPREGESVTSTYTINLWDNFTQTGLTDRFEGGYRIDRSDTEFIQTGFLSYEWLVIDGEINIILDFDVIQDMQVAIPDSDSGNADVYFRTIDVFESGTFSLGTGEPRAEPIDQMGNKLTLTLDLSGDTGNANSSIIAIDFYDNGEGGYESTRTDTEANQFGDVTYTWIETGGETRVDLFFDAIPPMQVYLTPQPTDTGTSTGDAKIHFISVGQVGDATYEYIVGGGIPRPVPLDKNGTQLSLDYNTDVIGTLTIDLFENFTGFLSFDRSESNAVPTGLVEEYEWTERQDGTELVTFLFDLLPDIQVILTYDNATSGMAEILDLGPGTVTEAPFRIGTSVSPPPSINKSGTRLVVDIEGSQFNDRIEVDFIDPTTGIWAAFAPDNTTPRIGLVDRYSWQEYDGYEQVTVIYDFFLDTQIFLNYTSSNSGIATVFFITGLNIEEGTFTIENP